MPHDRRTIREAEAQNNIDYRVVGSLAAETSLKMSVSGRVFEFAHSLHRSSAIAQGSAVAVSQSYWTLTPQLASCRQRYMVPHSAFRRLLRPPLWCTAVSATASLHAVEIAVSGRDGRNRYVMIWAPSEDAGPDFAFDRSRSYC